MKEPMNRLACAQAVHEINRRYCEALGDHSQVAWEDAPAWQTASTLASVRHILDNPDAGDEALHVMWMENRRADGWVWGRNKCADAKTHPCLVPFTDLPIEQQMKDRLFCAAVRGIQAGRE